MSLIIFGVSFIGISILILKIANKVLINDKISLKYIKSYIKGTARGSMGLFESNSTLESKRMELRKRNTKF